MYFNFAFQNQRRMGVSAGIFDEHRPNFRKILCVLEVFCIRKSVHLHDLTQSFIKLFQSFCIKILFIRQKLAKIFAHAKITLDRRGSRSLQDRGNGFFIAAKS